MLNLRILFKESGGIEDIEKNFNIFAGSRQNILFTVAIPKSLLDDKIEREGTIINNIVRFNGVGIDNTGKQVATPWYTFARSFTFVKDLEVGGVEYSLFSRRLPDAFTRLDGTFSIVIKVLNMVSDDNGDRIDRITTSQRYRYQVLEGLPEDIDEEPSFEPSELEWLSGRVDKLEKDMILAEDLLNHAQKLVSIRIPIFDGGEYWWDANNNITIPKIAHGFVPTDPIFISLRKKDGSGEVPRHDGWKINIDGSIVLYARIPWTGSVIISGAVIGDPIDPNSVVWDRKQNLSPSQQAQARENINALSSDDITGGGIDLVTQTDLAQAINTEAGDRQNQFNQLDNILQAHTSELEGRVVHNLVGAFLSLIPNDATVVQKVLWDSGVTDTFIENATLINDANGTVGVYSSDIDSATIEIITLTTSGMAGIEIIDLGEVATYASLPSDISDSWFTQTPNVGNRVIITADENASGNRTRRSIVEINNGSIIWGNPVTIQSGDFQTKTDISMSGQILTGGAMAGTFGTPRATDITPTAGSNNLITSGGVATALLTKGNLNGPNTWIGDNTWSGNETFNGNLAADGNITFNQNTPNGLVDVYGDIDTDTIQVQNGITAYSNHPSFIIVGQTIPPAITCTDLSTNTVLTLDADSGINLVGEDGDSFSIADNNDGTGTVTISNTMAVISGGIPPHIHINPAPVDFEVSDLTVNGKSIIADKVYSTTETDTGKTWIDGSIIYRCVFQGNMPAQSDTEQVIGNIANYAGLAGNMIQGYVTDGNGADTPLTYTHLIDEVAIGMFIESASSANTPGDVKVEWHDLNNSNDYANCPVTIVVEYTKTV